MRPETLTSTLDELNNAAEAHAEAGEFDAAWEQAVAREGTVRSRVRVAAPLAVAAAALLFVGWGVLRPAPVAEEVHAAASVQQPNTLSMGAGHTDILELPSVPKSIAVVLPEVANVQNLGLENRFLVQGMRPGRTDISVVFEDGTMATYTVLVTDDGTSPRSSGWADVPDGGVVWMDAAGIKSVAITNPEVVKTVNLGNGTIGFKGMSAGTTDVGVNRDGVYTTLSLHVGQGSRSHALLSRPPVRPLEIQLGSVQTLTLEAVKSVSIVRPDRVSVHTTGEAGRYNLMGKAEGMTDMVVMNEAQEVVVYRVNVR